jgi:hypothetical protein
MHRFSRPIYTAWGILQATIEGLQEGLNGCSGGSVKSWKCLEKRAEG